MIKNRHRIPVKFQDGDIACQVIETLLEIERRDPGHFAHVVEWIASLFEKSNTQIGHASVMGRNTGAVRQGETDLLRLDDFLALRFQNRETGRQLIITLMEMEARVADSLYGIKAALDTALGHVMPASAPDAPEPSAQIVPFPPSQENPRS